MSFESSLRWAAGYARLERVDSTPVDRCPACNGDVSRDGHAVPIHGHLYHAGCALYRPRHQAAGSRR